MTETSGSVRVFLIRHGRTAYNHQKRFLGCTDEPLDEEGHAQARSLAARFASPLTAVYASPLSRASETAEYLGQRVSLVKDLRELHQGHLEGMKAPEAIARYPGFFARWAVDPTNAHVPGGESLGELQARAVGALTEIVGAHRAGDQVAVVTHQMVIASLSCAVQGQPLARWREFTVPNTAVCGLDWRGQEWVFHGKIDV